MQFELQQYAKITLNKRKSVHSNYLRLGIGREVQEFEQRKQTRNYGITKVGI